MKIINETAFDQSRGVRRHHPRRQSAQALAVKPSTISYQLKKLEDQLGTALFIRTTRSISLTEAGRALARSAGPAFDQLGEGLYMARTEGHAARGSKNGGCWGCYRITDLE